MSDNTLKKGRYTRYSNKIGLYSQNQDRIGFLNNNNDVVLSFPFKDTVLEAGMDKEDKKRDERFLHQEVDGADIDTLLESKVFTNFEYYSKENNSVQQIEELSKDQTAFFDDEGNLKQNLLIKGNNLLALHSLSLRLAGKVKLIYIDPPYNTETDSFKYNDNFTHSSWLTFMKNRLEVARELLDDNGAIFISCDDNESHYLKVLTDEIFGRDNFITNVIWQKKYSPQNDAKWFSDNHDHILVFAKNKNIWRPNLLPRTEEMNARYKNPDNDPRGPWKSSDFSVKTYSKTGDYAITTPSGRVVTPPNSRVWGSNEDDFKKLVADNRIWFGEDGSNVPSVKKFLSEVKDGVTPLTIWTYSEVGHNQDAKKEVNAFDHDDIFDTPKPEQLIQRILHLGSNENDLILDFCLGSGTTCAVAHKMGRRWVGVEQMDYIENITKERLKSVIDGEQGGISKDVNWQGGGSFIYFELKKYNQDFLDKIMVADSKGELDEIYSEMAKNAFLKFWFDKKEFEKDENFRSLDLDQRKELLISILDENQLYLNHADMCDSRYHVTDEEMALTDLFYGANND